MANEPPKTDRMLPVSHFHSIIESIAAGYSLAQCGLSLELESTDLDRLRGSLPLELHEWCGDFDERQASEHAASILAVMASPNAGLPGFVARQAAGAFEAEALGFAELIGCFVIEIGRAAAQRKLDQLVFFARDAIPLYVVAKVFARRGLSLPSLRLLELNRSMFPAFPHSLKRGDPQVERLLQHLEGLDRSPAGFVDTGAYGTLKGHLDDLGVFARSEALFVYSKNVRHYGFLNRFVREGAQPELCEAICDTIETWPKPYSSSRLADDRDGIMATTKATGAFSSAASWAVYAALARWAEQTDISALQPDRAFARLVARPTPLMLGQPLPQWKHAAAWFAQQETVALSAD